METFVIRAQGGGGALASGKRRLEDVDILRDLTLCFQFPGGLNT